MAKIPPPCNLVLVAFQPPYDRFLATATDDDVARLWPWRAEDLIEL